MSEEAGAWRMTLQEVYETSRTILLRHGFSEAHAAAISRTIRAAEADECHHHGLFRLPFCVRALKAGQASPDAVPTESRLAPGVIRLDAHRGFIPLSLEMGEEPLAELAMSQGIAALAINNANNVGPLWPEIERLASRGLVAFAFTSTTATVAPFGGTRPLFGTNPIAFGWPRLQGPPLVFDQATSASARGEIQVRLRDGRSLPDGWAIGPDGQPTDDPATALAGAQLPFGGAKGSSIALMIELLAGPLIGDVLSFECSERDTAKTGSPCGGELVLALDPARFVAGGDRTAQLAHGEALFRQILAQDGTRLPSSRRYAARERTANAGIMVAPRLRDMLVELGATFPGSLPRY